MLNVLRRPGFAWIAAIYSLDYVVELASSVALMVLVYDATDSPTAAAVMLVCKQVIPGVLTASLGRVLDRVTIRAGLTGAYLLLGASLGVLASVGHSPLLYALAITAGTAGAAVRTLLRAAVARTTAGQVRREANGALNVLMGIVALIGPAIGALLVSQSSTATALSVMAAAATTLAAASILMPAAIGGARMHEIDLDDEEDSNDDDEAAGRPAHAAPRPAGISTRALLAIGGLVLGLFAMDEPALLAYAEDSLSSGVGGYGVILTAWGAGMIFGSLLYGRLLAAAMPRLFAGSVVATALGYLGLGLAPSLEFAIVASLIGGAGNGVLWVSLVTAVQESASDAEQTSVAARLEGIATAAPAIGMLVGGVIAELLTPRASLLIPGALAIAALAAWALLERASLRSTLVEPRRTALPADAASSAATPLLP